MSLAKALHHIAIDGFYVMENVIQKDEPIVFVTMFGRRLLGKVLGLFLR